MSNTVYPEAKESLLSGDIDLLVSTISIQMYDDDAIYDAADVFVSDVTGTQVGPAVDITGKAVTNGQFTGSVGTFTPPGGATVIALIVHVNTGSDATSRVLAWLDTKADTTPISIPTTGGSIVLHWNDPFLSIGG